MSGQFTIARVYAKAIFDLSVKQNKINQWASMLEVFSKITENTLLQSLCFSIRDTKKLSEILIVLFEDYSKNKLDLFGGNFIYIIVKNKRTLLLPIIFKEFNNLYNDYMRFIIIEVISARKLNDNQLRTIVEIMTDRLSKTVKIVCRINKNILAGIIIKIGNTIIDGSLTGRILRLGNILRF